MKKILIIGSGAHAAELSDYIEDYNRCCLPDSRIDLRGFIDYDYNIEKYHNKYGLDKPVLGDIETYVPIDDEFFIIGISDISFRNKIIDIAKDRNLRFTNFIHHSCIISKNVQMGYGNVICPGCIIGSNAKIGDFNFLNCYSTISHDCIIGNNNILSSYSGLAGHVTIKNDNFLSLHSAVIPGLTVGSNNVIQAGMIIDKAIGNDEIIFHRFKEKIIAIPKADKL